MYLYCILVLFGVPYWRALAWTSGTSFIASSTRCGSRNGKQNLFSSQKQKYQCWGKPNALWGTAATIGEDDLNTSAKTMENKSDDDDDDDDDSQARSAFGTKEYWDDVYAGRGDFPADEYSWYYGWDAIKPLVQDFVTMDRKECKVLIPGIGNDPILVDLLQAGFCKLTAQDYSEHAIERQQDLLYYSLDYDENDECVSVNLAQNNVKRLPASWANEFDLIVEKGLLDAVYLSGDGNVEQAVKSLARCLKPNGIFISVSGVVPAELRKDTLFPKANPDAKEERINEKNYSFSWKWLRDGSDDLKAGCFVFQKNIT